MTSSWIEASQTDLSRIRGVCLDIDDTLSTEGKLTPEAFSALWELKGAGFAVVPVTGRPAGWCDHIARFWPVDAVVGENGAFTLFMKDGVLRRIETPGTRADAKTLLAELGRKIRVRFPQAIWASDQPYRDYDLAIDFCEDVPRWANEEVEALLELCHSEGAHAKLSSIHVNAWFGDYDKRKGFAHWLDQRASSLKHADSEGVPSWDEWLFIGDSPNDEPMFAAFPNSVGVANLKNYLDRLTSPPRWITSAESGKGFVEMSRKLIQARGSAN